MQRERERERESCGGFESLKVERITMGKNEKTGLGRALVRQHNQMIQQSKEKGYFYRNQHKKVLESVTEVSDIDAIIEQADEADRLFTQDHPAPNLLINLSVFYSLTVYDYLNC